MALPLNNRSERLALAIEELTHDQNIRKLARAMIDGSHAEVKASRVFTADEQERGRTTPVLKSQGAYSPPPPARKHHDWLMALALIMGCVGVLMIISAIWTGLYYTLGGQ